MVASKTSAKRKARFAEDPVADDGNGSVTVVVTAAPSEGVFDDQLSASNLGDRSGSSSSSTDVSSSRDMTSRRLRQKEVAERRASHFARADKNPISSTPTGSLVRMRTGIAGSSAGEADEWPGPFATARNMMAQREEAKRVREEAISSRAATDRPMVALADAYDKLIQDVNTSTAAIAPPSGDFLLYEPVLSLAQMCVLVLSSHFDDIEPEDLQYLSSQAREQIAIELAKLTKCTNEAALKLAVSACQCLVLPECSNIDEDTMIRAIERTAGLVTSTVSASQSSSSSEEEEEGEQEKGSVSASDSQTIRVLRLRNCGRNFSDRTCATIPYRTKQHLEVLQVTGCYRLSDGGLSELLAPCMESLMSLDLTCDSRLGVDGLRAIRTLVNLQELVLDHCSHLSDHDLLQLVDCCDDGSLMAEEVHSSLLAAARGVDGADSMLLPIVPSTRGALGSLSSLSFAGLTEVTDRSVSLLLAALGPQLTDLNLSRCIQLTDTAILAMRSYCTRLRTLQLSMLPYVTATAIIALFICKVGSGESEAHEEHSSDTSSSSCSSSSSSSSRASSVSSRIGYLEEVHLSGTPGVTDDAIILLCENNHMSLRLLDVSGCDQLTNRSVAALVVHCRSHLEVLNISFDRRLSEQLLSHLVHQQTRLRQVIVWGCSQLTSMFFSSCARNRVVTTGRMTA